MICLWKFTVYMKDHSFGFIFHELDKQFSDIHPSLCDHDMVISLHVESPMLTSSRLSLSHTLATADLFVAQRVLRQAVVIFNVNRYVLSHVDVFFSHVNFSQVAGIKGMFLANKKIDNQVKTFITYNKGRDWRLLQAPDADLRGDPVHCLLVSPACSNTVTHTVKN